MQKRRRRLTDSIPVLRILVVADDPLARAGLANLLSGLSGCDVVGQVGTLADELAGWETLDPDVALWDVGWDPSAGAQTPLPFDAQEGEAPPVVALLPDESRAAEAWSAGARGLLSREADPDTLLNALASVAQGLVVFDPLVAGSLLPPANAIVPQPGETLTPREMDVLQLIAEGLPNKAIALELDISEHTVKFHVNAILGKLDAQSRTEAVVRATRLGLIFL